MRHSTKIAGLGIITSGLLATGVAFAAWTASGTGSGYAQAGTAVALATVQVTPTDNLYPGGMADVEIEIVNPNPYPVRVISIAGNGPITSGNGACDIANGVTFADQTGGTWDVLANNSATFTLTNAASMSNASVDACQGATFTIPVTLAGASNAS